MARKKRKKKAKRMSLKLGIALSLLISVYTAVAVWFVHHPRAWLDERHESLPSFIFEPLLAVGNVAGDITDALSITGHDAVYEYDIEAPKGKTLFAGAPKRIGAPAPHDILTIDRGHFIIGWSPSRRRPVWCAYHVTPDAPYIAGERPKFQRDKEAINSPKPGDFSKTGYDRGHMIPNYAIATRYGPESQRKTFLMGNIAAQSPSLNRGPWREIEHRIADLWAKRWGEIWVITGCYCQEDDSEVLSGSNDINVADRFYQILLAQDGMNVRALAIDLPQTVTWRAWPARHITTIDELETRTGLDFLPELPNFIQSPLEAELPTRLWPVSAIDIFKMLSIHFK